MEDKSNVSLIISAEYEELKPETYKGLIVKRVKSVDTQFESNVIVTINTGSFDQDMNFIHSMLSDYDDTPVYHSSSVDNYIDDRERSQAESVELLKDIE